MAKTSILSVSELNIETQQTTVREMNEQEILEHNSRLEFLANAQAEAEAKEAARQATIAKLAALGLTPEDLAAL